MYLLISLITSFLEGFLAQLRNSYFLWDSLAACG
jgi:hypothetical protein